MDGFTKDVALCVVSRFIIVNHSTNMLGSDREGNLTADWRMQLLGILT